MNIKYLLQTVERSKKFEAKISIKCWAEEVFGIFNIVSGADLYRLTSYWYNPRFQEDRYIGIKVYFLYDGDFINNELVAIGYTRSRNDKEEIKWLSKESYYKTKEYVSFFADDNPVLVDWKKDLEKQFNIKEKYND